jgi:hypothetical protein
MVRRYLGSVSARVVAEAPCSVTVVRRPREEIGAAAERVAAQRVARFHFQNSSHCSVT